MTAPGSPSGSDPYLSIVLTGRNDNFGGDFNETIQPALRAGRAFARISENQLAAAPPFLHSPSRNRRFLPVSVDWASLSPSRA